MKLNRVTHEFKDVKIEGWGDKPPEPKVPAAARHFAPPEARDQTVVNMRPAGKPSAVPDDIKLEK